MNILTLDFETYFDDEYTVKKLTTEAYVRDPRFEVLGVGLKFNQYTPEWYDYETGRDIGADLVRRLDAIDWSQTAILCHHAHFDALILSHHYGIKPRFIYDSLSMARLQLGNHVSASLQSLADHYGLQAKNVPYNLFKGKRWRDLGLDVRRAVADGCLHDVGLTWGIFQRLAVGFPAEEYTTIDYTVRMFTEPSLVGDVNELAEVWRYEQRRKAALLEQLAVTPGDMQSAARFVELLEAEGVEVPTKAGKNGPIPCVAKTDDFMQELLEDDNERVRTLAEGRLGIKSTLDQTRSERLGFMSTRGPMCVYLGYAAAHTTRWGGGDKTNWQNFKRGSPIRRAIKAPPGHKIVKADKSQIECRILNYVAGQWDVIENFANGADPYVGIASRFYGRPITKTDPAERGVGKQLELSCGYGAGADTIVRTAKRGTYGPPVQLSYSEGLAARDLYRDTHAAVVRYWKDAGRMISALAGSFHPIEWGPLTVETGVIRCQGLPIWYPDLHYHRDEETGDDHWRYKTRKGWAKLYGGKLTENVVQFMSRVDMSQSLLRVLQRTGIRPAQLEHDAAVWVVPDKLVDPFVKVATVEMTRAPTWLPDIPLGCEVTVGETL